MAAWGYNGTGSIDLSPFPGDTRGQQLSAGLSVYRDRGKRALVVGIFYAAGILAQLSNSVTAHFSANLLWAAAIWSWRSFRESRPAVR